MMTCERPAGLEKGFPFEISRTGDGFVVAAALPGVEEADIRVTVDSENLTISAERKRDEHVSVNRSEIYYGKMERVFSLPDTIDTGSVEAVFKNGVLTVSLPTRPETRPRAVDIKRG